MINNLFSISQHDLGVLKALIFFSIISVYTDLRENLSKCKNKQVFTLFLHGIHHFTYTLLHVFFLFENKYILIAGLVILMSTVLHWSSNKNKCFLTQHYNDVCQLDNDKDLNVFTNSKNKTFFDIKYPYIYILIIAIKLLYINSIN